MFSNFFKQATSGSTLIQATKDRNLDTIKQYCLFGDVNDQDNNGDTALMIAVYRKSQGGETVREILSIYASLILYLHQQGAKINIQNNSGQTALMQIGTNPKGSDDTYRINIGRGKITAYLFELYGSKINVFIEDKFGYNALDYMLEEAKQENDYHQGIVQLQERMKSDKKDIESIITNNTTLFKHLTNLVLDYSHHVRSLPDNVTIKPARF